MENNLLSSLKPIIITATTVQKPIAGNLATGADTNQNLKILVMSEVVSVCPPFCTHNEIIPLITDLGVANRADVSKTIETCTTKI